MGMNHGDDSDRFQKLLERIAEEAAKVASKKALEQAKKKALEALVEALPVIAAIIGAILVIFAMVGAAVTLKNAFSNMFEEKYPSMTEEDIDAYLDDPENIYACLNGQNGALLSSDDVYKAFSPAGLAMLDRATTYEIFKQIHEYNQRRAQELSISYTIRHESRGTESDVPNLDDSLNLETENFGNNEDAESDYSTQEYRTITRAEVEKDIGDNGRDIFALRWQPIYAALSIAAAENNGYWGEEATDTFETGDLETKDVGNYYLTSAQIQQVIDIFYLRPDYYYDALGDLSFTNYQFLDMEKNTSAFKVEYHDWTETKTDDTGHTHTVYHRVSKRIPYSAPSIIKNGFETYEYGYTGISTSGKDRKCANRKYDAVASKLLACIQPFSPTMIESLDESGLQFEATNFILLFDEYLQLLPDPDNELHDFYIDKLLKPYMEGNMASHIEKFVTTEANCPSIGVIFSPGNDSAGEPSKEIIIEDEKYVGTGVLFGDYINGSTRRLMPLEGVEGKYSKRDVGAPLAEYKVNVGANRSITTSGNYTEQQIYQMLANSPVKSGKTSTKYPIYNGKDPRFACESAMRAVAHAMYEWQGSNSMDVAAFMAISRKEGIGSLTPTADYNFVNQVASKSMIAKGYYHPVNTASEGVHNFASYKNQACDEWYRDTYGTTLTKGSNSGEQNRTILENYFNGLTQEQREKVLARAVKLNLTKLYNLWCISRGRTNFKEFIFNKGYRAGDWSSLTLCYCPPYSNDFPFRGKEDSAAGWANGCGTYLEEYRSLAGK